MPLLERPARADVARDLRGTDDPAAAVAYRGDGERDLDQAAVLAAASRLQVVDPLAAAEAGGIAGISSSRPGAARRAMGCPIISSAA